MTPSGQHSWPGRPRACAAGLQAWPLLRREEAELVAQVRQALGPDRFDQVFAAGARLTQQEAVGAAGNRRGASTSLTV